MIPAEAVEAAAKRLYVLENQGRSACPFDNLPQTELDARIELARAALEAAAPHMLAAAKAEALEDAIEWLRIPSQPGGGFAAGWLKIRAKEYRKGNL